MVGLPARGKTYIGAKIARYLQWLDVGTKIFNVGTYRRELFGAELPASFFDPANEETSQARVSAANAALSDMLESAAMRFAIVAYVIRCRQVPRHAGDRGHLRRHE